MDMFTLGKQNWQKDSLVLAAGLITILASVFIYRNMADTDELEAATLLKGPALDTSIHFEEPVTAKLAIDGSEVQIFSNTYSSPKPGRIILIFNEKTGITKTLTVDNYNIGSPRYRILIGNKHDWLIVTKIDNDGTGYIRFIDEWYVVDSSGNIKYVMSYPSKANDSQYNREDSLDTVIENKSYADDLALDIKFIIKKCISSDSDGQITDENKVCSESLKNAHYVWDNKKEAMTLDVKRSELNQEQINNLLSL